MNVNDIIKETNAELERLIGGTAASSGAGLSGGIRDSVPAYVVPAYIRPAPGAALPHASREVPRHAPHGQGMYSAVPGKLEHSLLDPGISREKIVKECELAGQYGVANVVVSPYFVEWAADILKRGGWPYARSRVFPTGLLPRRRKAPNCGNVYAGAPQRWTWR